MPLEALLPLGAWFAGCFVLFGLLERLMPCNPGHVKPLASWRTDAFYWFVMPFFSRMAKVLYLSAGLWLVAGHKDSHDMIQLLQYGYGPLASLPVWLQAAMVFIFSDILLYWAHRLFHTDMWWRFHAIHHSSQQLNWISAARFHPVNVWLTFTLIDSGMLLAGFSPAAIAAMAGFNTLYSAMVHSNLNWTFGPFRYVLASPVFHRWHHTLRDAGMNRNFAPTFPLLDIAFGTFYMPAGQAPQRYGIADTTIPESFLGQLAWPFRVLVRKTAPPPPLGDG